MAEGASPGTTGLRSDNASYARRLSRAQT